MIDVSLENIFIKGINQIMLKIHVICKLKNWQLRSETLMCFYYTYRQLAEVAKLISTFTIVLVSYFRTMYTYY